MWSLDIFIIYFYMINKINNVIFEKIMQGFIFEQLLIWINFLWMILFLN